MSEASLHGHLKNEGKGTNAREEELGSSSYVNLTRPRKLSLSTLSTSCAEYSDAAKKRAEAKLERLELVRRRPPELWMA